jgi:hypothetical protein
MSAETVAEIVRIGAQIALETGAEPSQNARGTIRKRAGTRTKQRGYIDEFPPDY